MALGLAVMVADSGVAEPFAGRHLAGIKIGPWFTNAEDSKVTTANQVVDVNSTGFHFELFYHRHLRGVLYGDVSFGGVSRGQISIRGVDTLGTEVKAIGDAAIYPIGIGVKVSPLATHPTASVQPFVQAGGTLLVGTQREQTEVGVGGGFLTFDVESRSELGYYAGVGVDVDVGGSVAIGGVVKYQHAKFGEPLFGATDYSGVMVLVGVAYVHR